MWRASVTCINMNTGTTNVAIKSNLNLMEIQKKYRAREII